MFSAKRVVYSKCQYCHCRESLYQHSWGRILVEGRHSYSSICNVRLFLIIFFIISTFILLLKIHYILEKKYENISDFNMQIKCLLKIQQNQRLQLSKCICKEIKAKLASELSSNDLPVILHSTKSQKIIFLDRLHFKEESLNIHFFSQQLSICKEKKIEFLGFTGSFAVQKICKRLQYWLIPANLFTYFQQIP